MRSLRLVQSARPEALNSTPVQLDLGARQVSSLQEYPIWVGIRQRCFNPNVKAFARYGGRGVRVCSGWDSSFSRFFTDLGPRPSPQHSVDRIDNDAHYSCGSCEQCVANGWVANCRWATQLEQTQNRRPPKLALLAGTRTVLEAARKCGVRIGTIYERMRRGWDPKLAVTTSKILAAPKRLKPAKPPKRRRRLVEYGGRAMTMVAWSREIGVAPSTLRSRIKRGMNLGEALRPSLSRRQKSEAVLSAIAKHDGVKSRAAAELGIDRRTIYRWIGR